MRPHLALVLLFACGSNASHGGGSVSIVIDIPNGPLDPKGFVDLDVILHEPTGDIERSAKLGPNMTFDLGDIPPTDKLSVEATLRNDSGAAVGYGRTAVSTVLMDGGQIDVPVRRPIAYIAGLISTASGNPNNPTFTWTETPATISDLSVGTTIDGRSQVGSQAVLMISAGPNLFMIEQAVTSTTGQLTGPASVKPIAMADHKVGAALSGTMTGGVIDGAGTDDGNTLVIGTTSQLFQVDAMAGTARPLASGEFDRIAVTATDTDATAIAIKNRTANGCTAELWWFPLTGGEVAGGPKMIGTGGYTDVAAERGHAYYVDACKGELGEATATGVKSLRTNLGKPTALAVSNGQAYVGLESAGPASTSLVVASVSTNDAARTLWSEAATQILDAPDFPGVQRSIAASSAVFQHLEVGAGGDYIALSTSAHFSAPAIPDANFPEITTLDTEEMRVFSASTGAVLQRYRSWCDGVYAALPSDIQLWRCATATGQSSPADRSLGHHIGSLTFLYGKK